MEYALEHSFRKILSSSDQPIPLDKKRFLDRPFAPEPGTR